MTTETLPGVNRAYDFVIPSYNWALQALENQTKRLHDLLTLSGTLTFAAPVLAKAFAGSSSPAFDSPFFILAMVLFGIQGLAGLLIRVHGSARYIDPNNLDESWLRLEEEDFKAEMIKAAALDRRDNSALLTIRANTADFLTIVLVVEVILLAVWLAKSL